MTKKEVSNILKQFKADLGYAVSEAANLPDLVKPPTPKPDDKPAESDSTMLTDDRHNPHKERNVRAHKSKDLSHKGKNQAPTEDIIIDKINDHRTNRDRNHRYGNDVESLYHIRWYCFEVEGDTWKRILHLTRRSAWSYCKRKKLQIAENIDESDSS